ncbi:MAG: hypothetical protein JXA99_16295 [Candidatus Lokiarchaeota archaeon]|nr:hypothetical protein [Candidatus Lokiarchaeota archaeon]
MKKQEKNNHLHKRDTNAIVVQISALGTLGGFISIEHGIFEIFQGNTPPNGIVINAIASGHWYWKEGNELAITLIPNFLITGIFAIIIGILAIIWSIKFIQKNYGPIGLFILTILALLFGGGVAFLFIGIINCFVAFRREKSQKWWQNHLSAKVKKYFSKIWFPLFLLSYIMFILLVLGGSLGVWFLNPDNATILLTDIGLFLIILIIFTFICGFTYDNG